MYGSSIANNVSTLHITRLTVLYFSIITMKLETNQQDQEDPIKINVYTVNGVDSDKFSYHLSTENR